MMIVNVLYGWMDERMEDEAKRRSRFRLYAVRSNVRRAGDCLLLVCASAGCLTRTFVGSCG